MTDRNTLLLSWSKDVRKFLTSAAIKASRRASVSMFLQHTFAHRIPRRCAGVADVARCIGVGILRFAALFSAFSQRGAARPEKPCSGCVGRGGLSRGLSAAEPDNKTAATR